MKSFPLDGFHYVGGRLHAEDVGVEAIAEAAGTPLYIYSAGAIQNACERIRTAFEPLGAKLRYAVKASANLQLCRLIRGFGAGMDVVSGGELERAWLAGTPMEDIVFAGVGKTEAEVRAALDGCFSLIGDDAERFGRPDVATRGPVGLFNAESASELERLERIAGELGVRARVCVRVNPDVDARTHEYTTTGLEENKFGIYAEQVPGLFDTFAGRGSLDLVGLHVHIGSPVREIEPYVATVRVVLALMDRLEQAGHRMKVLNVGGGWAVDYEDGEAPQPADYAEALVPLLAERAGGGLEVLLEPGRSIMANSGVLVTRVQHVKKGRSKRFVICDAGMNALIRPALYRAFHFIWPVRVAQRHVPPSRIERPDLPGLVDCDVVGPVCETGDFLARRRALPEVGQGDLMAVFSAGAYGMSMASNYNDHGRPVEVLVDGDRVSVINERQRLADFLETERTRRELNVTNPV